ncbi:IclR family transcriptional regulator [Ramlibacter sp.]|uniref:IclR family transcriptional regulator n=1 Tax=Ramlibacter sp. TaxID=1917967 RepID=UPI003D12BEE4
MKKRPGITGAQSAGKALELLRLVSMNHLEGLRLSDAVELSGLDRSTTHRLLACLVDEGFVDRAEPLRRYRLGMEAMQFGLLSTAMTPLVERFRHVLRDLAQRSGDTAFLVVQSGDHALCIHREEGAYPIKALLVEVGTRRVLGASGVGVGVLARLQDAEVDAIYGRQKSEYRKIGLTLEGLRRFVEETRKLGYSQTPDHTTGEARGVGCAVRLSDTSYAGISLAAINARMTTERRRELGKALVEALRPFEAITRP